MTQGESKRGYTCFLRTLTGKKLQEKKTVKYAEMLAEKKELNNCKQRLKKIKNSRWKLYVGKNKKEKQASEESICTQKGETKRCQSGLAFMEAVSRKREAACVK